MARSSAVRGGTRGKPRRAARPPAPPGTGHGLRTFLVLALCVALLGIGVVAGIVASYSRNLPDISRMADYQPSRSTRVMARDGSELASLYKENRVWAPIDT